MLCKTSFANIPNMPEGEFSFSGLTVSETKHEHILDFRSSNHRDLYNFYRNHGYFCKRHSNSVAKCYKSIAPNPNKIKFDNEKFEKLNLMFGELFALNQTGESELVDTFDAIQEVTFEDSSASHYKAYLNHKSGDLFLDIKYKQSKTIRFKYTDDFLTHLSYKIEKLSRNEIYKHTLIIDYKPPEE